MLRSVHWAPISVVIAFSAWASVSGCQASGSPIQPILGQGGSSSSSSSDEEGGEIQTGNGGTSASNSSSNNKGGTSSSSSSSASSQGGSSSSSSSSASKGGTSSGDGGTTSSKGGTSSTKSSTTSNKGGTSASSSSSTTSESTGGTTEPATTAVAQGGATITTSSASVAQTCTTDLVSLASGTNNNWIANTTGQSCSVQGSIYAYGDGVSITSPGKDTAASDAKALLSPCTKSGTSIKCCISGTTKTGDDATYWGGGIGLDLNATGSTKNEYAGTAKGFKITLTGTFPTTAKIRVGYSGKSTTTDPFKEIDAKAGTYSVAFADATCPTWATASACTAVTAPTALKIQLVGGGTTATAVGAFEMCVASILPN